ncbi:hypothetical protein SAMN00808754_0181 [Thermanaeromonas toyohensis ToBE]|uniref:Uncharacterized protein n=2 Tax=Thermanaeromonas TaxID=202949 RepID=A0A1W1V8F5_9FIRM|nr:hypothetical protein SAMN00808754_0181 [Thermanaeromonas toyohensis ToBE]
MEELSPPCCGVDACMIDPKPRPNHRIYIEVLREMTPEQRLAKAFELSALGKELFLHGLRERYPDLSEEEIRKIYLERISKCHNRNY